nr:hypothetical protein [Tanacetum cinerariifolium]
MVAEEFQHGPDDEEDTKSSQEYMNDLEIECHERDLLAKSKRFFKDDNQRPTKDFEAIYNKVKAKLVLFSSADSTSKSTQVKNQGLVVEAYEWDEKEVSSNDNKKVEVKVLMAVADDESGVVGKEIARKNK